MIRKKMSVIDLIAFVLIVAYVDAKESNILQPNKLAYKLTAPDDRSNCIKCCDCPLPTPAPPLTLPPPIPLPPTCIQRSSSLALFVLNSCNNCSDPNCSTAPEGSTFPYPNHCQFFWQCANQMPVICYCPNGTWYDRVRKVCDYCPNVKNCPANTN